MCCAAAFKELLLILEILIRLGYFGLWSPHPFGLWYQVNTIKPSFRSSIYNLRDIESSKNGLLWVEQRIKNMMQNSALWKIIVTYFSVKHYMSITIFSQFVCSCHSTICDNREASRANLLPVSWFNSNISKSTLTQIWRRFNMHLEFTCISWRKILFCVCKLCDSHVIELRVCLKCF